MKKKDYKQMATTILKLVNGGDNVLAVTNCMTRLRLTISDMSYVDMKKIEELEYVIKVQFVSGQLQIVLGPGVVDHVTTEFESLMQTKIQKNDAKIKFNILDTIQKIVGPALGALIAIGLITSLVNILMFTGRLDETNFYIQALQIFSKVGISSLSVVFAINTAKHFKSNVALTTLFAIFLISPSIEAIVIMGEPIVPGMGGMFSAVFMAITIAIIEKQLKKVIPNSLQLLIVPLLTSLLTLLLLLVILIPVSAFITNIIVSGFIYISTANRFLQLIGSVVLAIAWPFLVMTGLHASLFVVITPIYMETGLTPLLAAALLSMPAQLGASWAYVRSNKGNLELRQTFSASAFSIFLGISEPILYGINLPHYKTLIVSAIGAAIGAIAVWIFDLTMTVGLGGILSILFFDTPQKMMIYAAIWFGTIIISFIIGQVLYKLLGSSNE